MAKKFSSMTGMTGTHRVTLVGEPPVEVRFIGADIMRWEQNEKGKSFYEGTPSLSRMTYVAWAAMKRQGMTEKTFAEFMKVFEDLESEDDADEVVEVEDEGVDLGDPTEADTTAW